MKKFIAKWMPFIGGATMGLGIPIPPVVPGWPIVLFVGIAITAFSYYAYVVWGWGKDK